LRVRETERDRQTERERERVCVRWSVCSYACVGKRENGGVHGVIDGLRESVWV